MIVYFADILVMSVHLKPNNKLHLQNLMKVVNLKGTKVWRVVAMPTMMLEGSSLIRSILFIRELYGPDYAHNRYQTNSEIHISAHALV